MSRGRRRKVPIHCCYCEDNFYTSTDWLEHRCVVTAKEGLELAILEAENNIFRRIKELEEVKDE